MEAAIGEATLRGVREPSRGRVHLSCCAGAIEAHAEPLAPVAMNWWRCRDVNPGASPLYLRVQRGHLVVGHGWDRELDRGPGLAEGDQPLGAKKLDADDAAALGKGHPHLLLANRVVAPEPALVHVRIRVIYKV